MKNDWSKIFLLAALLLLAVTVAWLAVDYPDTVSNSSSAAVAGSASKKIALIQPETTKSLEEAWTHPSLWQAPPSANLLFTPRRFLYFLATGKVELAGPDTKIDGIPLDWLLQHGLDASDPDVVHEDPDGDGFDNLAEYLAGTDPRDPKSHPSYIKLLRVQSFQSHPFPMTLASVNALGGQNIFQVNTPKGHRPTNNVRIGDSFEGFKVIAYRPKQGPKKIGDMQVVADISELELQKEATGETVILSMQETHDEPMISATFVLLLAKGFAHPVTVAQGAELNIDASPSPDMAVEKLHYKFLSVDAAGAKLGVLGSSDTVFIPSLSKEEGHFVSSDATQKQ